MRTQENLLRQNVTLDARTIAYLRALGAGSLSRGIRIACSLHAKWDLSPSDAALRARSPRMVQRSTVQPP